MSIPFHKTTTGHVAGDSITAGTVLGPTWVDEPGGLNDQTITALGAPPPSPLQLSVTSGNLAVAGAALKSVTSVPTLRPYWTHYGIGGWTVENLYDNRFDAIRSGNSDVLILEIGVNDLGSSVDITLFTNTYGALLDDTITWKPAIQIICLGILMHSEAWTATGPHFLSGVDTPNAYDSAIATLCAARPSNCVYKRQYDWALAWEIVNNTPPPGVSGAGLTVDGIHPNPIGRVLMGTHVLEVITLS